MSANHDAVPGNLQHLDIHDVMPNEQNPRLIFPQGELDLLAESIEQQGILVPIVVYAKDGKYVLIDGERRFKCAQILGLATVPATITTEKSDLDLLLQMFNIHLIREPWQDMPTAKALHGLAKKITATTGIEPTDNELRIQTGLSMERVRRLRYATTLPPEWQDYIQNGKIPLNFFWELKKSVIDPMARLRPDLLMDLDVDRVMTAFVQKRLDNVVTDSVSLRNVTPIIRFSADAAKEGGETAKTLDESLRGLIENPKMTIEEVYEESVQIMVEVDKLERRSASMFAAFSRLVFTSKSEEDRVKVTAIAERLIQSLQRLVEGGPSSDGQSI